MVKVDTNYEWLLAVKGGVLWLGIWPMFWRSVEVEITMGVYRYVNWDAGQWSGDMAEPVTEERFVWLKALVIGESSLFRQKFSAAKGHPSKTTTMLRTQLATSRVAARRLYSTRGQSNSPEVH